MSSYQEGDQVPAQIKRLVDWNTEVLHRLLKQVVVHRQAVGKKEWDVEPVLSQEEGKVVFDEVADVIALQGFSFKRRGNAEMIELPNQAKNQLRAFVAAVANAYHGNPMHGLQYVSAVTMQLSKLLSRVGVQKLDEIDENDEDDSSDVSDDESVGDIASHLHSHTYGITSDPLTQFGLVLAAFIHAVDHAGISNSDLALEDPETASRYKNRSIIEQRSVEKAWTKLMQPGFYDLRRAIYSDEDELKRFRQVIVNSVLSTDVQDSELQIMRTARWEKALNTRAYSVTKQDINRKATIVLEHLMQASTIFYTMQPWIVYEKWCSRDFEEKYVAFKKGRVQNDPSIKWLENELEFFDNWCIPLAMQLKDCDAFVVNTDEHLKFALKNRQQLAVKGKTLIPDLVERLNAGKWTNTGIPVELSEPTTALTPPTQEDTMAAKHNERLVKWNVEILKQLLKQVVAKRQALGLPTVRGVTVPVSDKDIYDEVVESIELPGFDRSVSPDKLDAGSIDLGSAVEDQLQKYVLEIAAKFAKDDFHNVDHESQVCMSIKKMLTRITTILGSDQVEHASAELDARTFGVSSDPLSQFAVVFAGLIHHVDHPGVPNSQLILDEHPLAKRYKNRCILEQHSIAVAWELLMQQQFEDLRAAIFSDETEALRFRQILVNCILGTNFMDEDLLNLRKKRWARAFLQSRNENSADDRNRRATILLELLMQASDVFHATSTWPLYQKWSERQFLQVYKAFKTRRLMQNPSIFWYKSEMLFFDEHVVPIAQRISACGVFEQSTGDQYLSFSLSNRQQWAAKGADHIASMMARYHGIEIEKSRTRRTYRRMSLSATTATMA